MRAVVFLLVALSVPAACSLTTSLDGYAGPPVVADAADAEIVGLDAETGVPGDAADAADAAKTSAYATTVLGDRPVVYFRLGETAGASGAMDLVSGRSGAFRGIPMLGVKGALAGDDDTAMRLDGTNGVTLSNVARFGGKVPYSLEAWVRPTDVSDHGGGHVVMAAESGDNDGYSIFFYQSFLPNMEREYGTGDDIATGVSSALPSTTYTYLVGTYDGTTERIYVNGAQAGTVTSPNAIPATNTVPFAIGGNDQASSNTFIGDIDEVAAYDYALSVDTIKAHYQVGMGITK